MTGSTASAGDALQSEYGVICAGRPSDPLMTQYGVGFAIQPTGFVL
ncbi:MAG: hypothetical protein ABWZ80_03410 [Beijerinckiaceae bacterium]